MNVKKLITLLLAVMMVPCHGRLRRKGKRQEDRYPRRQHHDRRAQDRLRRRSALYEEPSGAGKRHPRRKTPPCGKRSLWPPIRTRPCIEDGKNYGQFLLDTIEDAKDQFTEEELKVLREGGEKIRDMEDQLTKLEEKFPELMPETPDGNRAASLRKAARAHRAATCRPLPRL